MKILRYLSHICLKSPKLFATRCSYYSQRSCLVGRDFISPEDFSPLELKHVLWTAADLKVSSGKCLQALDKKKCNVTILINEPSVIAQVAVTNAIHNLGLNANVVHQACMETSSTVSELGRALTQLTDAIVTVGIQHHLLKALCDGASVPVVNFNSCCYQPVQCLANLLSVQEKYCFLRNLTLGWIGPWNASLNTYLIVCPKFGMNIQFAAIDEKSNKMLKSAILCAIESGCDVSEKVQACEAIYRAHIIATAKHDCEAMKITRKLISDAATNWSLLPELPRSHIEVTDDIFNSRCNLLWKSTENVTWVSMAILLNLFRDYCPGIPPPDFDGCNVPVEKYYQK